MAEHLGIDLLKVDVRQPLARCHCWYHLLRLLTLSESSVLQIFPAGNNHQLVIPFPLSIISW